MCSRSLKVWFAGALIVAAPAFGRDLRVCADPNNLPFSNEAREGFENRIVELIAQELDADVTYYWHAQRRGFLRETLKAGNCDVVPGLPSNLEGVRTTLPYYRSSYQFVVRSSDPLPRSFNDPLLRERRVGVQLVGDDGWNTPPAHALARRGITDNIRGYTLYGDYREPSPPSRIVKAVADGEIDIAVAWGPLAGYSRPVKRCRCRSLRSARHSTAPSFPWFGTSRSRCAKTTTGSGMKLTTFCGGVATKSIAFWRSSAFRASIPTPSLRR